MSTQHESARKAVDFEQAIEMFTAGRLQEAQSICRALLTLEPRHPHALHMLGLVRAEQGFTEEGLTLVRQALDTGVVHPAIHYAHGNLLLRLGRYGEAAEALQRSLELDPGEAQTARLLGVAFTRAGRIAEAEAALRAALRTQPRNAPLLDALGMTCMAAGRYVQACKVLEQAVRVDPDFPDAYGNLAIVYEQINRLADATRITTEGLRRWPEHGTLRLIRARLARREGDCAGAQKILHGLQREPRRLPALDRDIEFELGWCADNLGDADTAFQHFSTAKAKAETLAAPTTGLQEIYPRQLRALTKLYSGEHLPLSFPQLSVAPARDLPVFLLGFPRSGTTLLDTMLDAHGAFAVMEEQPSIQAMLDTFLGAGCSYPDDLPHVTVETETGMRGAFFRVCHQSGWDGIRQLVDKSPFATAHVGLIQRIFPGAPLVFMLRHPCDVVLSCFISNFEFNSGTVHFTRLESTVRLYCDTMALWFLYRQYLPLHHIMLRYENLVTKPEGELRRLLDFLDVPWSPAALDHASRALKRGRIPTPSYHQVSRPLYQDARGRWRRYQNYLEPYLSQLRPYCELFGYEI